MWGGEENSWASIFHCVKAKMVWKMAPIQGDGLIQQTTSFKEWWRTLENVANRNGWRQERIISKHYVAYLEK